MTRTTGGGPVGVCKEEGEQGERRDVYCAIPRSARTILDVGCGVGLAFQPQRLAGCSVIGVDSDPACVERAKTRLNNAWVFDLERDEWPAECYGQFDVVAFNDVLEHVVDPWRVLARVRPLLSPDGVIVASIPNIRQWRLVVKTALGRWPYPENVPGTMQRGHLRFFTRSTIADMFAEAGYERPRFYWPWRTPHLRRPERALHVLTLGRIPDLWYGSYTVQARPKR